MPALYRPILINYLVIARACPDLDSGKHDQAIFGLYIFNRIVFRLRRYARNDVFTVV